MSYERNLDRDAYGRPGWYRSWYNMISRCYCPSHGSYKYYGGKGIQVCPEWRHSSKEFEKWALRNNWKPGKLIDRIDGTKDYAPENCRWVTPTQSNRNRSTCRYYTIGGVRGTISQWAAFAGMKADTLRWRLDHGWDITKAINTPVA